MRCSSEFARSSTESWRLSAHCTEFSAYCTELSAYCTELSADCTELSTDCTEISADCTEFSADCTELSAGCWQLSADGGRLWARPLAVFDWRPATVSAGTMQLALGSARAPRAVPGAPAGQRPSGAEPLTVRCAAMRTRIFGGGAENNTRGRGRDPFLVLRLHRSGSTAPAPPRGG